jgi:hypothetical protein
MTFATLQAIYWSIHDFLYDRRPLCTEPCWMSWGGCNTGTHRRQQTQGTARIFHVTAGSEPALRPSSWSSAYADRRAWSLQELESNSDHVTQNRDKVVDRVITIRVSFRSRNCSWLVNASILRPLLPGPVRRRSRSSIAPRSRRPEERDHLVTFLRLAGSRSDSVPRALGALLVLKLAASSRSTNHVVPKNVTFRARRFSWS